ncbi:hypothetical protein N7530_010524 [Penicillium desertorum]|uniref:Uncharacterized protein n=1 Tax=Penicillium desertorum TaxID=1303715 RepID=A0A9W9WHK2_9EURO|nr:hypothetical protein N7530_010524 [Penicillium desertorum]
MIRQSLTHFRGLRIAEHVLRPFCDAAACPYITPAINRCRSHDFGDCLCNAWLEALLEGGIPPELQRAHTQVLALFVWQLGSVPPCSCFTMIVPQSSPRAASK